MKYDLADLVLRIQENDPTLKGLGLILEKEILHYDILYALQQSKFLEGLTFCGGTALRLCHGAPRLSEDLDFEGGEDFAAGQMGGIETCLKDFLGNRYGLHVKVRPPKDRSEAFDVPVNTWRISVITNPQKRDLPWQHIHLDIATIPSNSNEKLPLKLNYTCLPVVDGDIEICVKTKVSIIADKIVAFSSTLERGYPRWRDLWDLWWLTEKGVKSDVGLIKKRSQDCNQNNLNERINQALEKIPELLLHNDFIAQMSRFLPPEIVLTKIKDETWRNNFSEHLCCLFSDIQCQLTSDVV